MARKSNSTLEAELLSEVKECYENSTGAENENTSRWVEDMNFAFVPGAQWDQNALNNRQGRPCYSYNRVVGAINQVIGDQRQARPMAKVRPASKQASLETAEIYGGMIRNIESCSGADAIYDQQYKYAVAGGFGAWRIISKYKDYDSFDQELELVSVSNPLNVSWDPSCQDPFKRDSMYCVVAERLSRKQYKSQFSGFEPQSFDVSRDNKGWCTKDEVRVAEYFKRVCKKKKIALLSDGRVVDDDAEFRVVEEELARAAALGEEVVSVIDRREAEEWTVKWWKVDGAQILEGPIEYKWKRIPVIRLPGRYVNIEGKQILSSLIRFTKDSQRSYNYNRSTMIELVSLTPRAPYIGTAKMFEGYEQQWNNANKANRPWLAYNPDTDAPGARPTREPPPDVPQALIALATQDAEDIKQTTGYYNPAMMEGEGGVDQSGRALIQQSRVGDSGTYEFIDNLAKAIQYTAECMIDMIPTVYVGPQVVRILGQDGVEDYAEINQVGQDGLMNSLAEGKYDVTVTMGPAFATARQDALRTLMETITAMPIFGEIAPDLIAKNLDVDGGDELYKRMRKMLIGKGIVEPDEQELKEMGPPQEPPPDPVQVAMVERLKGQTARDAAATAKTQAETVSAAIDAHLKPIEIEKMIGEIVNQQLQNLLAARDLSMPHASVVALTKKAEAAIP
jgi:hypothetical protein